MASEESDDAKRWHAVHARITGLSWCLIAAMDGIPRDRIIANLLQARDLLVKAESHPAAIAQVDDVLEALDPTRDSIGPSSQRQ